jgi:hypothetical protein
VTAAGERGAARTVRERLEAALGPRAGRIDLEQAAGEASRAGLPGLARLLVALASYAGAPWPAELLPALDRLRRLVSHPAVRAGMIETLRVADASLAAAAGEVEALERRDLAAAALEDDVPTLTAAESLGEHRLAHAATARAREIRPWTGWWASTRRPASSCARATVCSR